MFRRLVSAAALAVAAVSCFEPPTKERQQAEGALAAARVAEAGTYAEAALSTAEQAFARYDAAVADRDYKQALRLAIEARDGAYDAARRAGDEKAARRSQAEHLAREVEGLIGDVEVRATQTGLARASAERLKASARSAAKVLQEARSNLAAERYALVTSALTPVGEGLRAELTETATPRRSR